MKKTMVFAAFAALISLASCQKEEIIDNGTDKNDSPVFTASILATRTTVDVTDGKVAWEADDEITVTDAASASAVYTVESIDATTGKATFVIKSGETSLGAGPYTASYGTEPATAQTYSATAGKLYMTAPATSGNSFDFTVQCGLMKLNLTKTGESVKNIAVTGTPTGGSETTYTLSSTEAQSIASAKDFFIALPAGNYTKIEITNVSDSRCTLNSASGIAVVANHIKPVTFGESKINFAPALLDEVLAGEFTVNAEGKKVHFSRGNLYAKYENGKWNWIFYDRQYKNNSIATTSGSRTATDSDTEIDLFTWGFSTSTSLLPTGRTYVGGHTTDGDQLVYDKSSSEEGDDWGVAYCESNNIAVGTWRTLSTAEWQYLFGTSTERNGRYKYGVTVCGKTNCVVLLPDNWQWDANTVGADWQADGYPETKTSNEVTWEVMEKAGAVCLPAAGRRYVSNVYSVGDRGYYWSSSSAHTDNYAYGMYFHSSGVGLGSYDYRHICYSVRLITESK